MFKRNTEGKLDANSLHNNKKTTLYIKFTDKAHFYFGVVIRMQKSIVIK